MLVLWCNKMTALIAAGLKACNPLDMTLYNPGPRHWEGCTSCSRSSWDLDSRSSGSGSLLASSCAFVDVRPCPKPSHVQPRKAFAEAAQHSSRWADWWRDCPLGMNDRCAMYKGSQVSARQYMSHAASSQPDPTGYGKLETAHLHPCRRLSAACSPAKACTCLPAAQHCLV